MGYGPASARGLRYTVFWLVAVIVVIVDQATKAAVRMLVSAGSVSTLIPGILNLTRVQNTGAAFGVGKGGSVFFVVFAVWPSSHAASSSGEVSFPSCLPYPSASSRVVAWAT